MPLGSTVAFRPMRSATMFTELSIRPVKRACVHKMRTKFQVGSAIRKLGQGRGRGNKDGSIGWLRSIASGSRRTFSRVATADATRKASRLCFSFFESEGRKTFENQSPLTALE